MPYVDLLPLWGIRARGSCKTCEDMVTCLRILGSTRHKLLSVDAGLGLADILCKCLMRCCLCLLHASDTGGYTHHWMKKREHPKPGDRGPVKCLGDKRAQGSKSGVPSAWGATHVLCLGGFSSTRNPPPQLLHLGEGCELPIGRIQG